jgi:DivIVA domain-containing protein
MLSRSTGQPGPVTALDERVSGAILVDWAAGAASTTFSSTGLGGGYAKREVDLFRSAVRDTFLGVGGPPMRSDDVRGKQFLTHRPGYDEREVAGFLEAASLRLAAMESTDRATGPPVSGAFLAGWAEWADSTTFSKARWRLGYAPIPVDAFREEIRDTFLGATRSPVKSDDVRSKQFLSADFPPSNGYDKKQVDAFLDAAGIRLAAMERREIPGVLCMSTDRPDGPLVSDAILAGWAEWADSTRFSTSRRREGYDTTEVDAFREEVRDTFLGASKPPDEWPTVQNLMPWPSPSKPPARSDDLRGKQFSTHRPGYDKEEVDAFLDKAVPRLAAMRATDKGAND